MGKTVVGVVAGLLFVIAAVFVGKNFIEREVQNTATRPYRAPSGLVVAAVNADYGSRATADGSIVLERQPSGAAAGLAGFYRGAPPDILQTALAVIPDAHYTALEAPKEPCRSDADSSVTTLGELALPERKVKLWTCTLTKKGHAYFLVWASSSSDFERQLSYQLKTSQLVSNKLCAVNVINGGCSPNPSALVAAVVTYARQVP